MHETVERSNDELQKPNYRLQHVESDYCSDDIHIGSRCCGRLGESGIRTHGTVSGSAVFKTAALNRSAISP